MKVPSKPVFWIRHGDTVLAALIVAATLALFWPATRYDFVMLDDDRYVVENPVVAQGLSGESVRSIFGSLQENLWIPLTGLSYALDVEWGGRRPFPFHLTNVLLHALNAGLLFALLRRWTGSRWAACWAALIWAWHPLRTEGVAWISCRKDVLSGLFFLLCLRAYARSFAGTGQSRGWFWASAGFLALGLMSKSTLMATPFVLLLLDEWPLGRAAGAAKNLRKAFGLIAEKWPFWGMATAAAAVSLLGHEAAGSVHPTSLGTRLARVPIHVGFYLWRTFAPRNLAVLYADVATTGARVALATALVAAALWATWRWRRRWPMLLVGWLWFLGALLPVSGIVAFGAQSRADRYVYLPAMGLSLAAAGWLATRGRPRWPWFVAGILSLAAAAGLTRRQLPVWKDSGALLERALAVSPVQPVALMNYGVWKYVQGDLAAAEGYFLKVQEQQILNATADRSICAGNLGYLRILQGRTKEAQEVLRPKLGDPYVYWAVPAAWGMSLIYEDRSRDAIPYLEDALRRRPGDPRILAELQRACFEAGRTNNAQRLAEIQRRETGTAYATYEALFPHYVLLWQLGGRAYAWRYFERLADSEWGRSVQLLNNVAWLAATDDQTSPEIVARAVVFAERAAERTQGKAGPVLDTLAVARAAAGDYAGAVEAGERALALAVQEKNAAEAESIRTRLALYRAGKPFRE